MAVKFGRQTLSVKGLMRKGWLETEMRVSINQAKAQYAQEQSDGSVFPAPVIFFDAKTQRSHCNGSGVLRKGD